METDDKRSRSVPDRTRLLPQTVSARDAESVSPVHHHSFDEAQDANPVTSSIVLQQNCKVITVGDRHQQIYRFRGANNALDSKELMNADQLYLTHSFRFGPNVSLVANALLELKGETRPVVGRGPADQVLMFYR